MLTPVHKFNTSARELMFLPTSIGWLVVSKNIQKVPMKLDGRMGPVKEEPVKFWC